MQIFVQAFFFSTLFLLKKRGRAVVYYQSLLEVVLESLQGYVFDNGQVFLWLKVACPLDELWFTLSLLKPFCSEVICVFQIIRFCCYAHFLV